MGTKDNEKHDSLPDDDGDDADDEKDGDGEC